MKRALNSVIQGQRYHQYVQQRYRVMASEVKPVESSIRRKLTDTFQPSVLEVQNESNMHNVPKGSETHFKVLVVSDKFESMALLKRHRMINETLGEELNSGVHALSIVAKTKKQWDESNQSVGKSPPCMGGGGR